MLIHARYPGACPNAPVIFATLPIFEQASGYSSLLEYNNMLMCILYDSSVRRFDMALWTLLVWLGIGALAGFFTRKIAGGTSPFGVIGDIILGLAGGVLGGYLLALSGVSNTTGGLISSIIAAIFGAVILVWSTRFLKKT